MKYSRISEERKRLGLSQEELATKLKISQKSISKYECGTRRPSYETLVSMASIFNVSTDYLLGKTDLKNPREKSEYSLSNEKKINSTEQNGYFFFFFDEKDGFIQNLISAIEEAGLNEDDFKATAPIGSEKANALLSGEIEPSANDLIKISQFLNSSIDYLLGQEPRLSDLDKKLLDTFAKLDDDNKDILIGEAKKLWKEQCYSSSVAADEPELKTGTYNRAK